MMRPRDDDDNVETETETETKAVRTTAKWPLPILPDELIIEIMMRLPVSSLVQFRSVCKSWRTLISSPQFAMDHLQGSVADPSLTHPRCVYTQPLTRFSKTGVFSVQSLLESPSAPTKVVFFGRQRTYLYRCSVLGSCNGLICLHQQSIGVDHDSSVMLWNPCTGSASKWIQVGSLVTSSGFGYDHMHGSYKLFVSEVNTAKIFTFGMDDWRTIENFQYILFDKVGSLVSGTLNWIYRGSVDWEIVSFDLGKETHCQWSLPDRNEDSNLVLIPSLGVLRNCLAVGCDYKKTHWAVWLMKEYGVHQSWTKLAMIPHDPVDHFLQCRSLEPLYMCGNDVLLARVPHPQSTMFKLGLFNLNNGRLDFPLFVSSSSNEDTIRPPLSELIGGRTLIIYHESLLSPSHLGLRSSFTKMRLNKRNL